MDLLAHLNAAPAYTALVVLLALFTLPLWLLDARKAYFSGHKNLVKPLSVAILDGFLVTTNFWKMYAFAGENVMATILVVFAVYCCLIYAFVSPASPSAPTDTIA